MRPTQLSKMNLAFVFMLIIKCLTLESCSKDISDAVIAPPTVRDSVQNSGVVSITLANLRKITSPDTSRYYVTDAGKEGYWRYDPGDKNSADNIGTIVVSSNGKRFKREYKDTINVRWFGAQGNSSECTKPFQAAVGAGKIIYVPDGTYMIKAGNGDRAQSIWITSDQNLILSKNAVLKVVPNNLENYNLIRVKDASNVKITGGTFAGDKPNHSGTSGEGGHLIALYNSTNVTIKGVTCKDAWGDGIYIGATDRGKECQNITIDGVTMDNARRNGLAIVAAKKVVISNSTFKNTKGTKPEAGLDVEPNPGYIVDNIQLKNLKAFDNAGPGIESTTEANNVVANGITAYENGTYGILISSSGINNFTNCVTYNNERSGTYLNFASNVVVSDSKSYSNKEHGFFAENCLNTHKFENCEAYTNTQDGFNVYGDEFTITIDSCISRQNTGSGFFISPARSKILNSQSYKNGDIGVFITDYATATNNTIYENGTRGLRIYGSNGTFTKNYIHSNSQRQNAGSDNVEISAKGSNNKITGNTIKTGTLTKKPRYGIYVAASSCTNNVISPNDVKGSGATKDVQNLGTGTVL